MESTLNGLMEGMNLRELRFMIAKIKDFNEATLIIKNGTLVLDSSLDDKSLKELNIN